MNRTPSNRTEPPPLGVAAGVVLLLAALDLLGRGVPWIRANELGLFAAIFLLVPGWADPQLPGPLEANRPWRPARALRWALAATAAVLLGFLPAFHLWQTRAADLRLAPALHAFDRPPDRFLGQPAHTEPGALSIYHLDERVVVTLRADRAPWRLALDSDGTLHTHGNAPDGSDRVIAAGETPRVARVVVRARDASWLTVHASLAGEPVPVERIDIGAGVRPPRPTDLEADGVRIPLSVTWLPLMVLAQLLLIAVPEEYFFRRYLQAGLARKDGWSRRWYLAGPLFVTPAILLTSTVFALLHFLVGLDPTRLAVFFPSLLFGWLFERTQGTLAPVLVHAACNLMVLLASTQYLPA